MNLNLTETIDVLEVIVVGLGLIGLPISLVMLAVIQAARRTVRNSSRNGAIKRVNTRLTNSDLRNELSRTYKLFCYLVLGVVFMFVPPPQSQELSVVSSLVRAMLISFEIVATMNTLWGYIDYRKNSDDLGLVEENGNGGPH